MVSVCICADVFQERPKNTKIRILEQMTRLLNEEEQVKINAWIENNRESLE